MEQYHLNLYENGIDSIKHALEHYVSDDDATRKYKYAILHLTQGLLLLLKERLRMEHPNFIFRRVETDVADADIIRTVNVEEVLLRLKKIAKVDFGSDETLIRELAELRNSIEHYKLHITKKEADVIIGRIVPFLASFMEVELQKSLQYAIGKENWQALLGIQDYFKVVVQEATNYLSNNGIDTYLCSNCNASTAMAESEFEPGDPFSLAVTRIRCIVCRSVQFHQVKCLRCGRERSFTSGFVPKHGSYCEDCRAYAREKFGTYHVRNSNYVYVAEVERWFAEHDIITAEDLLKLLRNVSSAGSSSISYPISLYREGIIDFVSDFDRKRYAAMERVPGFHGFESYYRFRWMVSTPDAV